jgi:hypothetical protein
MSVKSRAQFAVLRTSLAVCLVLATMSGCGQSVRNPVAGQVEFRDGKPLTAGRLIFESTDGISSFNAQIAENGSYKVDSANIETPPGEYVVFISGAMSKGVITRDEKGKPTVVEPQVPLIDAKFTDAKTSPLKATVEVGENEFVSHVDPPAK